MNPSRPTRGDLAFTAGWIGLLVSIWLFMASDRGRNWTIRHWQSVHDQGGS